MRRNTGVKESTLEIYDRAQECFFSFFDKDRQIASLKPSDILEWKCHLQDHLAEATIAAMFAKTKAVFNWAVAKGTEKGWLEVSPLQGISGGSYDNPENDRFIEVEEYHKLLEACPCQEWRMIITLSRIGGLRCPSESQRLRWDDIHWDRKMFKVTTSKLEHHKGKGWRYVPLFPEVRRELEALRSTYNGEQPEYVINRYGRDPEPNLGTQFARIAKVAGLGEAIPAPFNNMRGSRATEIYAAFGERIEQAWLGHCKKIALQHYLMVRKGDYTRAANLELTEENLPLLMLPMLFDRRFDSHILDSTAKSTAVIHGIPMKYVKTLQKTKVVTHWNYNSFQKLAGVCLSLQHPKKRPCEGFPFCCIDGSHDGDFGFQGQPRTKRHDRFKQWTLIRGGKLRLQKMHTFRHNDFPGCLLTSKQLHQYPRSPPKNGGRAV